MSKYRL